MTDGDIQFGEIEVRPVEKADRPDQRPDCAVRPYGEPDPEGLRVYLSLDAFADIETHSLTDTSVELGGVLLGDRFTDDRGRPFVVIEQSLRAKHYDSSLSRFTYTAETWSEINRDCMQVAPDLIIVGWYHTHPGWGVFLSGHDTFIHENYFGGPLDVAYVVEPVNDDRAFFAWEGEPPVRRLPRMSGFYVTAPRSERAALEETVSRIEGRRMAEPAGGGVSGGQPILIQTPARPSLLSAAGFAVLCLLVIAQTGVLLLMYARSLEHDVDRKALATKLDADKSAGELVTRLERAESRLMGERDALRSLTSGLDVPGDPFLKRYDAVRLEAEQHRRRADVLETTNRVLAEDTDARVRRIDELDGKVRALEKERKTLLVDKAASEKVAKDKAKFEEDAKTFKKNFENAVIERESYKKRLDALKAEEEALKDLEGVRETAYRWIWIGAGALGTFGLVGGLMIRSARRRCASLQRTVEDLQIERAKHLAAQGTVLPEAPAPPAAPAGNGNPPPPADEVRIDS